MSQYIGSTRDQDNDPVTISVKNGQVLVEARLRDSEGRLEDDLEGLYSPSQARVLAALITEAATVAEGAVG